jgi:6-phosphogluconolactonase
MSTLVLAHESADELAHAAAARLVTRLTDLQAEGRVPSVVLTGGTIADKVHRAVAGSPARGAGDWRRVEVWFGDERFVPADSPDRNAGQAAEAMLDHLPLDPARVHLMPPSDGDFGDDLDAAARWYAEELERYAAGRPGDALFDVLILGVGPEGHCASLFPGHPALDQPGTVVGVRNSPKPPPTRLSLTMAPLNRADEVWWVAAGEEKADAVRAAIAGADVHEVPAAGPKGLSRTLWLLDREAASRLGA